MPYNIKAVHDQVLKTLGWWYTPGGGKDLSFIHPITSAPYGPEEKGGTFAEAILRLAAEGGGFVGIRPKRLGAVVLVIPRFAAREHAPELEEAKLELRKTLVGEHYVEATPGFDLHVWGAWPKSLGEVPRGHPLIHHYEPIPFYAAPLSKGLAPPPKVALNRPMSEELVKRVLALARRLGGGGPRLPWEASHA